MKYCCVLLFGFCILGLVFTSGCSQPGLQPQALSPAPTDAGGPTDFIQTTATGIVTPEATSPAAVTDVQPRGIADPDFIVDILVPESIQPGTTILADNHDSANPRIIEVNRLGEIVWEYPLANDLKAYTNPGWDVEPLPDGNILTVLPGKGVYEINRDKQVVWSYSDRRVSHDVDRLENGNTLVVYGAYDTKNDAQVKEVDSSGNIVWSWYAKDSFDKAPYDSISNEGWTHTNAVTRLSNGNTLISLRNFNLIAEVNPEGELVRTIGEGVLKAQHDPLVLTDGNILLANHFEPNEVIEMNPSGNVTWRYGILERGSCPVRDANRLANGNTLIAESDRIVEVTDNKQIVWQFRLAAGPFTEMGSAPARGFYKAERIPL